MARATHPIKDLTYEIPLDLHLVGRLRLNRASDFRAYFDEAESLAKNILSVDKFHMQPSRERLRPLQLDRMKRIVRVILGACEAGRSALKQRKKNEALTHAYRILDFRAELSSEPDRYKGENIGKHHSEAMKAKTRATRDKYISWQQQAEEIWREQPDLKVRETAGKIARETGNKWETIRKVIKKNKKTVEG